MRTIKILAIIGAVALMTSCASTAKFPVSSTVPAADITATKKQDKHNNVIERTVAVESSTKAAHNRLNDGEKQFERLFDAIGELKDYLMRGGKR